jgi:ABC-type antimicrobial peptide transport system permease subunit
VIEALESRLADFGLDAAPAGERLAAFHRVENTYLSTFQTLGALGLLLGTVGLATVLLRNALERRRELALLRAVGYRERHLTAMVIAENGLMLALGLGIGTSSALLAVAPAVAARGGQFPLVALLGLLAAVLLTGLAVSRLAVAAVHRAPLLASLRAE